MGLRFVGSDDGVALGEEDWVVRSEATKLGKVVGGLVEHAVLDEPSGGLGEEVDEDKYDKGRNELNADRHTPLRLSLDKEEAVSNQLSTSNAKSLEAALDHHL